MRFGGNIYLWFLMFFFFKAGPGIPTFNARDGDPKGRALRGHQLHSSSPRTAIVCVAFTMCIALYNTCIFLINLNFLIHMCTYTYV